MLILFFYFYLTNAFEYFHHENKKLRVDITTNRMNLISIIFLRMYLPFSQSIDKNERVHFNMGMLAMDDKNIEEAENWFRRAVHLKHDFRSALFNLALLLADDQRPLEAASFLNQLVKYHPDHTKGEPSFYYFLLK